MPSVIKAKPPANSEQWLTPNIEDDTANSGNKQVNDRHRFIGYAEVDNPNHPDFGRNGFLHPDRYPNGDQLQILSNMLPESKEVPELRLLEEGETGNNDDDEVTEEDEGSDEKLGSSEFESSLLLNNSNNKSGRAESQLLPMFRQYNQNLAKAEEDSAKANNNKPTQLYIYNPPVEKENGNKVLNYHKRSPMGGNGAEYLHLVNNTAAVATTSPTMVTSNTTGTNTVATINNNITGDTKYLTFNDPKLVPLLLNYGNDGLLRQREQELQREQQLEQKRKQRGRKQNSRDKGNIIKPQEQPGYVGDKEVDDIMKTLGFEQSPPTERKGQKANSPSNGTDGSAKKSAKKQKQKTPSQAQNNKTNGNGGIVKIQGMPPLPSCWQRTMDGTIQQQAAKPVDAFVVSNVQQDQENDAGEDMEVDIELDNQENNDPDAISDGEQQLMNAMKEQQQREEEQEAQQEQQEETTAAVVEERGDNVVEKKEEEKPMDKVKVPAAAVVEPKKGDNNNRGGQKKAGGSSSAEKPKAKWSDKLAAKKQQWKAIQQTPLIDRIPKNVLAQLNWKSPITLVNPYNAMGANPKRMSAEERDAIWTGPVDKWLEQPKPQMEQ